MQQFLPLGHGTLDTTQPSLRFEGYEKPELFAARRASDGAAGASRLAVAVGDENRGLPREQKARSIKTFVDWVLENGVTEPRLDAKRFSKPPGHEVAERRLPSNRFAALDVTEKLTALQVWLSTYKQVRPIDVVVGVLVFVLIAYGTSLLLAPAPPTLPPLR